MSSKCIRHISVPQLGENKNFTWWQSTEAGLVLLELGLDVHTCHHSYSVYNIQAQYDHILVFYRFNKVS